MKLKIFHVALNSSDNGVRTDRARTLLMTLQVKAPHSYTEFLPFPRETAPQRTRIAASALRVSARSAEPGRAQEPRRAATARLALHDVQGIFRPLAEPLLDIQLFAPTGAASAFSPCSTDSEMEVGSGSVRSSFETSGRMMRKCAK